jgi:alkylhydroperoxidase family enzyme
MLDDAGAWAKLPEVERDAGGPLPGWAKALAAALPRTTAAMLELDHAFRTAGLADARLRAMARWVAADANKSPYGAAYALADLRRAGATEADVAALKGDWSALPEATRRVLAFARQLTLAAYKVTDAEVARLRDDLGEPQLVALVQLLAYANFQDRLVLALGTEVEPAGPLPPRAVAFRKPWVGGEAPPRRPVEDPPTDGAGAPTNWGEFRYADLKEQMEAQRAREPRVSVPAYEDVRKHLISPLANPVRIRWSLVCLGHSPELANAWSNTTRAFGADAKQDRAFEELLFWVVTRSLRCFY